jgi:hypothetical protein
MWPHFRDVEDIPAVFEAIVKWHDLHLQSPACDIALLNVVEEIFRGVVGIGGFKLAGFFAVQILDSCVGFEVQLDPELLAFLIDPFEGVRGVAVHVSVGGWGASV